MPSKRRVYIYLNGVRIGWFYTEARTWGVLVDNFFSNVSLEPHDEHEWPDVLKKEGVV